MTPADIAAYAKTVLDTTRDSGAVLVLLAPADEERAAVVDALLAELGGGHSIRPPAGGSDAPLDAGLARRLLERAPNLAIEDVDATGRTGSDLDAVRAEVARCGGRLVLATGTLEAVGDLGLTVPAGSVILFAVGLREVRVATAADWARGQLCIPRDGGRPRFVSGDHEFARRVRDQAEALAWPGVAE